MEKIVVPLLLIISTMFATNCNAFNYVLGKELIPYTSPAQPAKGESFVDLKYHTTFYRVTDVTVDNIDDSMASPVYSRWTPLNSSKEYLYLQRTVGSPDGLIYSGSNYSLIKILPDKITVDGVPSQTFISMEGAEIRWDYTGNYPNRFYFRKDSKFYQYNLLDDTAELIHDFKNEFPTCVKIHNDVEGDSSADSRYWTWMVRGPYNGSTNPLIAIITYDKETNQILGVMDLAKYHNYGGQYEALPIPNMVEISPSGRKVIYHLNRCWGDESYGNRSKDIGTYFDGAHAWDLDFTNPVKVSITETHSGWAWDYDGNEVFVSQNNRNDWIESYDVMTGEVKKILYHGDFGWGNGFHFARMPEFIRGWILMSTYKAGSNTDWGDNQLIMLEIKDNTENPRVWRLGHTHNNYNEYYAEGFAPMSQFGDKLWWGAKWPGQNNIETYEMVLPPKWWEELSGGDVVSPGKVGDLSAGDFTTTSVTLVWTAPGDDIDNGTAAAYDVRYAKTSINETNWNSATQCGNEPIPQIPGNQESFAITGLVKNEVYYFALKTSDESDNTSGISNCVRANLDLTPPATVNDLAASEGERFGQVELTWTAVGDDGTIGSVSSYEIRYLTRQVTNDNWSGAAKCAAMPEPKPAKSNESFTVTKLDAGKRYYFAIKAIDDAGNKSPISNCADAIVQSVDPIAGNLSDVKAFPNPCRARDGGNAIFTNLTENCEIKIYNIAGEFVRKINEQTEGTAEWDLKNDGGEDVASGLYIYVITNQKDERKKGKLVVIR